MTEDQKEEQREKLSEFSEAFFKFKHVYPGSFWEKGGGWRDFVKMCWARFKSYDIKVIRAALFESVTVYPDKFPTMGQLAKLVSIAHDEHSRELAERTKNRLLPPPTDSRDMAKTQFMELCSNAIGSMDVNLDNINNVHLLEAVLVALGVCFNGSEDPREVTGYDDHEDPEKRFSMSKALIGIWKTKGYEVPTIARGLRKIPSTFTQWPTVAMIDDLIWGRSVQCWPEHFLVEKDTMTSPPGLPVFDDMDPEEVEVL